MKKSNAPVIISVVLLLVSAALLPTITVKGDWPTFRHDPSHSGSSDSVAPTTNRTLWTYTTGGSVQSSPAVSGGIVYIGSYDNKVYALNATTGGKIWNYTTGNDVFSSPAVSGGIVYVGSNDGKVYALNAATGTQIWNYTTGNLVISSPAVSGGIVYVGSTDGKLYALNATTGTQIWSYATGNPGDYMVSSPAVSGGIVYVGSYNHNVYALNATTGTKIWNYTTGMRVNSSPAVSGGIVYVGSYDDNVYALNATTGGKIWNYTTDASIIMSSPAVASGIVYIGSYDNKVYALNAATGTKVWSYATGSYVFASPAVSDGAVYVGSADNKVYAFGYTVSISFRTSGMGADVGSSTVLTIDSTPYNYTQLQSLSFNWVAGSTHTVTASDPVSGGSGKRYAFSSWTNGDGLSGSSGTYITPSLGVYGSATVTVNYTTQYWLVFQQSGVGVDFSGTVVTVNGTDYDRLGTSFWAYSGDVYSFAYSSPLVVVANGKQYVFLSANATSSLTVSGPETVTGSYGTQYYLTVVSPFDTPGGMGWYNESDTAYATLTYGVEDITSNVRAVFIDWIGDASGTGLTSGPITMNGAKTAIADWEIQYYLSVVTDPSSLPPIPGADWYANCTWVSLTAPQYVPDEAGIGGVRYRFSYWDVDGTSQDTGTNPIQVHMNAPHTATAHYVEQYYLTVETDPTGLDPAPHGEGWYDESTHLNLIAPPVSYNATTHEEYVFVYWDVDSTTYTSYDTVQIHMDIPHIATAHYWLSRPVHLDAEPPRLINLTVPFGTQWDELYPEYARHFEIQGWHDTDQDGRLSPCDYINLWDEDYQWELTPYFWHVDDITVTLKVMNVDTAETMYIEFEGGWAGYEKLIGAPIDPNGTLWLEVYPNYSREYQIVKWIDNCDSRLSYCDRIILRNTATGEMVEYHVEEVKTDLIVSPRTTQVVLYEFKEHVAKYSPLVISENIHNYYDGTTNFTMSAYYDGLQPIGNQTITLNPLESGDAIVTWNLTVTLPMGTYSYNITINTYANNTLLYSTVIPITFKITIVGDINGDGIVDMSDIGEAAMAFLSQLGEPRWNPNADTNGDTYLWPDGLVDLQDIGLIASKFLHTDP